MKIAFKIMSIVLLIYYGIPAVKVLLALLGVGAASAAIGGAAGAAGGFAIVVALIGCIPVFIAVAMAIKGIQQKYGECSKLAFIILFLDILSLVFTQDKAMAIFGIILIGSYIYLAKSLQKIW